MNIPLATNAPLATLETMLAVLAERPENELVFVYDGREISADYHVTELKAVTIDAIDCGRNRDRTMETVVQLLDGPAQAAGSYLDTGKFAGIAETSMAAIPALKTGKLYFEFAPENAALNKLEAGSVAYADGRTIITLVAISAACKPAQHWLNDNAVPSCGIVETTKSATCCGTGKAQSACCAA